MQTLTASMEFDAFRLKTIVVDLTPVLPGGYNGGAKVFVLELIRRLGSLAPSTNFVLLTHSVSHEELTMLDASNVFRLKVIDVSPANNTERRLSVAVKSVLELIPIPYRDRIKQRIKKLHKKKNGANLLHSLHADLLFCPFTAPTYHVPGIPTVCTFYDIQYKTYPQFFDTIDLLHRDYIFREACRHATILAAISDYSRTSAIKEGVISPDRIRTIYLRLAQRINAPLQELTHVTLTSVGLEKGKYLLYPANFWKHKNHEILLVAFDLARKQGLPDDIKLVCTGASGQHRDCLIRAADAIGLAKHVIMPGYLPTDELSILMHNSHALIFPSLYEGFGLPVIEAMAAGIPVACSNVTSLPEIAGEAALLFDPRIPEQIAAAIHSLATEQDTRARYIAAGYQRASEFTDSERMAREYLDVFKSACRTMGQQSTLTSVNNTREEKS
jgi:glycosyltransferase involved in cell wall biosynthesis